MKPTFHFCLSFRSLYAPPGSWSQISAIWWTMVLDLSLKGELMPGTFHSRIENEISLAKPALFFDLIVAADVRTQIFAQPPHETNVPRPLHPVVSWIALQFMLNSGRCDVASAATRTSPASPLRQLRQRGISALLVRLTTFPCVHDAIKGKLCPIPMAWRGCHPLQAGGILLQPRLRLLKQNKPRGNNNSLQYEQYYHCRHMYLKRYMH